MKTIAIIGGGISGISIGLELCKENFNVLIFEKQNSLGGLSSSLKINNFSLDFGPHIVSMKNNSTIYNKIKELMKENIIKLTNLQKVSIIFYQNKIWDTFPNLSTIIPTTKKSFLVKEFKGLISKKKVNQKTSKDYLIETFGKIAYDEWFKPFLFNRFTNRNPPLKMIKMLYPSKNFKTILKNKVKTSNNKIEIEEDSHFYFKHGMISLIQKIENEIENHGGIIKTNCEIKSIEHDVIKEINYIQNDEIKKINVDAIVYTIPIPLCMKWFTYENKDIENKKSKNLHCIMIFVMINSIQNKEFWTVNVFDTKKIFYRISQPNFLSKYVAPSNKSVLCIEIRCSEEDIIWNQTNEKIFSQVKRDLETMKIFNLDEIETYKLLRIKNIYPLEGYEEDHQDLKDFINSHKNEYAIGSVEGDTGRLTDIAQNKENIVSGGISMAFQNAEEIIKKIKHEFSEDA